MTVNKNSIILFRVISDIFIINIIFFIANSFFNNSLLNIKILNYLLFLNIFWLFFGKINYLYDDFRSRTFTYHLMSIIKTSIFMLIFMIIVFFFIKNDLFMRPRVFTVFYSVTLLLLIITKEYILRKFFSFLRKKGKNKRNILIVGLNEYSIKFGNLVVANPHFGYEIIGYLTNKYQKNDNIRILGKINEIDSILSSNNLHEVFIFISGNVHNLYDELIRVCNKHAVKVKIIPNFMRFLSKKFQTSTFGEFPIISVRSEPLDEFQWRILKRAFDLIFSFLVIVLVFSWLFPFVAIIQKITSKGPIFFIQKRIGKKGKLFSIIKFRTMYVGTEQKFQATVKKDMRITPFGAFLRKTNIDEIPQFINVFLGTMSIVGPRPHAIDFEKKYSEFVEEIRMRHTVKPGITGWAQTNGYRGDLKNENDNRIHTKDKIMHDIWYIENWSIWLDLNIIILTIWNILRGDPNAY